jgi:hypothetical protein
MRVAVLGRDGPLARAVRAALESRGHTVTDEVRTASFTFRALRNRWSGSLRIASARIGSRTPNGGGLELTPAFRLP